MKPFPLFTILLVTMTVGLAACGGGSSSGSTGNASTVLNVTMTDFAFNPNALTVPAGVIVTLNLTNNGSANHDFVIMKQGIQLTTYTSADAGDVYWQTKLDAGKAQTFSFTAPSQAGTYQVICAVPGHLEAGMQAELIVK